jgi:exosome complex exonuclease RRP6
MSSIDEVLLNTSTHDAFIKKLMTSLTLATKTSNLAKKGQDYEYLQIFEQFSKAIKNSSADVVDLIQKIGKLSNANNSDLPDDFLDPNFFDQVTDIIDVLLTRADSMMEAGNKHASSKLAATVHEAAMLDMDRLLIGYDESIEKPQLMFLTDIDNSRENPFRPRLHLKYHAISELSLTQFPDTLLNSDAISAGYHFGHPYAVELKSLQFSEEQQIQSISNLKQLTMPSPLQPFEFIETEVAFSHMLEELQDDDVTEIAVDLEHHSARSFQGLTCLMQVVMRRIIYFKV